MNIRLSSQALNWEIGDFGRVLEVLGNFSELDELKGLWLGEYLKNAIFKILEITIHISLSRHLK